LQKTPFITILYRILLLIVHIVVGITILATVWVFCEQATRDKLIRWWSKGVLWRFNIKVVTFGETPSPNQESSMILANHISWIDIYALNSVIPVRFIAKSDINNWPVFGYLARKSGTIFINRTSRKDTARIVNKTAESLSNRNNVAFFPEGTTTDGTTLGHFKSSLVQAAIQANCTIKPLAIRYPNPDGSANTNLAYAGETTMAESMMQALKTKQPIVELHFLPAIDNLSGNRQVITQNAYNAIADALDF
jgi:1-acyl-sn-glycerol-3-phosphate acyltransferase